MFFWFYDAFAKVFYGEKSQTAYLDLQALPKPHDGVLGLS